ncbi:MAG TPA: deoxyribodipyrimidine photo-lyase [Myxococcota bacterium]|nr:deoxyribodipyrimidine photo-lyase [Myxococcota bacterium]
MRAIHWFRADLRLRDNPALAAAARQAERVVPVFVLDPRLLEGASAGSARTAFLLDCLERLGEELEASGCPLVVRRGAPEVEIPKLLGETGAELLSFQRDGSPFAKARDDEVVRAAEKAGARVLAAEGGVVFAAGAIRSSSGGGYRVYTPYRKVWYQRLRELPELEPKPRLRPHGLSLASEPLPAPPDLAFDLPAGGETKARGRLRRFVEGRARDYATARDRPDLDVTSRLSPYLRFGVLSARACVSLALDAARADAAAAPGLYAWIDQLAWRDFYHAILEEHPRVLRRSFRPEFDALRWEDDEAGFEAWCAGRTGFPIVDAGMRQLAATGWMHNRVRMIVASFLTKDLLVDWRRGERFFYERLVDGDPANNNGGWQWAASTGTDAQPYFRIFNPTSQGRRFDPDGAYVKRFVPELAGLDARTVHTPWEAPLQAPDYPPPIVDHAERRAIALERFEDARARAREP